MNFKEIDQVTEEYHSNENEDIIEELNKIRKNEIYLKVQIEERDEEIRLKGLVNNNLNINNDKLNSELNNLIHSD